MNFAWDAPLKPGMRGNPVMYAQRVDLPPGFPEHGDDALRRIFPGNGHSLKTWGRAVQGSAGTDPHWIGVHKQTTLHTDPRYPRFTHHLIVRCDDFALRGHDRAETALARGLLVCIDTHSPHQLLARSKGARWYLAVSIDCPLPLAPSEVEPWLVGYGTRAPLLTEDILKSNNGGRW